MKTTLVDKMSFTQRVCTAVFGLLLLLGSQEAFAQFNQKSMAVGSLHNVYTETGGQQEYWTTGYSLEWPAIFRAGVLRADALWIGVQNYEGPNNQFDFRVAHVGPRVTGFGEFFPQGFNTIAKFPAPEVYVDDLRSFDDDPDIDRVQPGLKADRMITTTSHTVTGVTLTKRIWAYSQEYHDNYHVQEYVLTNTGNIDADEQQEIQDETAEGVYLHFQKRYVYEEVVIPGSGWGANVANDIVGDGMEDYETDFRAVYTWLANSQNADVDPLGGPAWDDGPAFIPEGDTLGQLTTAKFPGIVTLHADQSASDNSDDPMQPSMTGYIDADDPLTSANDPFDAAKMQREYQFMSQGRPEDGPHMYPHHADLSRVDPDNDPTTADGEPMLGKAGGWMVAFSYGPYDIPPGDSVRIVIAEAVDGLNREESMKIGQQFKADAGGDKSQADPEAPIEYDADSDGEIENLPNPSPGTEPYVIEGDEVMGKNDWFWTARDSLFETFRKALANQESGWDIPFPPKPPAEFRVNSGVNEITLSWTPYSDVGENPPVAFEVYRSANRVIGDYENFYNYEKIDSVAYEGNQEYTITDSNVSRGIDYYYYVQSVGEVNTNGTAMTPTGVRLRSSRYYTQTYDPASLKRGPGEQLSDFRIVPNPYNISSSREVRWPDQQDKLGFLDVPGQATIRIYTETGELVDTIEHTDGSGDAYWDLTTDSRQVVVSGLYIAVVENTETGEQISKKFVIIR